MTEDEIKDETNRARLRLKEKIDLIRKLMGTNTTGLSEMAMQMRMLELGCTGDCCPIHDQFHKDMVTTNRALDAAINKTVELRAHLAMLSNAINPPKDWKPTEAPAPKEGDLNVN